MTRFLALAALAVAATACGGSDRAASSDAAPAASTAAADCTGADTTAVMAAVLEYIQTVEPTPQRYLSAAGTDSGVPDDGFRILQDKGPTFFWAGSDDARAKLREKLERDGPWVSLLVLYRGSDRQGDGSVQVRLGGQYVANADDGKSAGERTFTARCVDGQWRVDGATGGKKKPATDSAGAGGEQAPGA